MASWLVYKCVDVILNHNIQHAAVIATGVITNVLVIISIISAFPWVRKLVVPPAFLPPMSCGTFTNSLASNYHNMFEGHHRLIGWLGLGVWIPRSTIPFETNVSLVDLGVCGARKCLRHQPRRMAVGCKLSY